MMETAVHPIGSNLAHTLQTYKLVYKLYLGYMYFPVEYHQQQCIAQSPATGFWPEIMGSIAQGDQFLSVG